MNSNNDIATTAPHDGVHTKAASDPCGVAIPNTAVSADAILILAEQASAAQQVALANDLTTMGGRLVNGTYDRFLPAFESYTNGMNAICRQRRLVEQARAAAKRAARAQLAKDRVDAGDAAARARREAAKAEKVAAQAEREAKQMAREAMRDAARGDRQETAREAAREATRATQPSEVCEPITSNLSKAEARLARRRLADKRRRDAARVRAEGAEILAKPVVIAPLAVAPPAVAPSLATLAGPPTLDTFLMGCKIDPSAKTIVADLYAAYQTHVEGNGFAGSVGSTVHPTKGHGVATAKPPVPLPLHEFGKALLAKGLGIRRVRMGSGSRVAGRVYWYLGIEMVAPASGGTASSGNAVGNGTSAKGV